MSLLNHHTLMDGNLKNPQVNGLVFKFNKDKHSMLLIFNV
jgi:hypothetical protein